METDGLELIEPSDFYNLLNQETTFPCLSDPVYLVLLDARQRDDYNESHVITARFVSESETGEYLAPYDADLECKTHVIVYDSNTTNIQSESPAILCASKMWELGSRNPVKILKGGYEEFSALYPFLRTKKIIYMPRELDSIQTYPIEVIPGLLYLGDSIHGNIPYIQKDLKIKGHINCSMEPGTFFTEEPDQFEIPVPDAGDSDLFSNFKEVCSFIDEFNDSNRTVLVYSKLGISRSAAVVIAYIMHKHSMPSKAAYEYVKRCSQKICPNQGFMVQLFRWERLLAKLSSGDKLARRRSSGSSMGPEAAAASDAASSIDCVSVASVAVAQEGSEKKKGRMICEIQIVASEKHLNSSSDSSRQMDTSSSGTSLKKQKSRDDKRKLVEKQLLMLAMRSNTVGKDRSTSPVKESHRDQSPSQGHSDEKPGHSDSDSDSQAQLSSHDKPRRSKPGGSRTKFENCLCRVVKGKMGSKWPHLTSSSASSSGSGSNASSSSGSSWSSSSSSDATDDDWKPLKNFSEGDSNSSGERSEGKAGWQVDGKTVDIVCSKNRKKDRFLQTNSRSRKDISEKEKNRGLLSAPVKDSYARRDVSPERNLKKDWEKDDFQTDPEVGCKIKKARARSMEQRTGDPLRTKGDDAIENSRYRKNVSALSRRERMSRRDQWESEREVDDQARQGTSRPDPRSYLKKQEVSSRRSFLMGTEEDRHSSRTEGRERGYSEPDRRATEKEDQLNRRDTKERKNYIKDIGKYTLDELNVNNNNRPAIPKRDRAAIRNTSKGLLKPLKRLGNGTFGKVYLCIRTDNCTRVAVKMMKYDDSLVDLYKNEYDTLKTLVHESIIRVKRYWKSSDQYMYQMEFIDGGTLEKESTGRKIADEERLKLLSVALLDGLMFLEGKGLSHNDIKSSNILVSRDSPPKIKLCDFSLVDHIYLPQSRYHSFGGSMYFMAPEILDNQRYDSRKTDLWAFGVVLFRVATKRFPFIIAHSIRHDELFECQKLGLKFTGNDPVSVQVKDFLSLILTFKAGQRPSFAVVRGNSFLKPPLVFCPGFVFVALPWRVGTVSGRHLLRICRQIAFLRRVVLSRQLLLLLVPSAWPLRLSGRCGPSIVPLLLGRFWPVRWLVEVLPAVWAPPILPPLPSLLWPRPSLPPPRAFAPAPSFARAPGPPRLLLLSVAPSTRSFARSLARSLINNSLSQSLTYV